MEILKNIFISIAGYYTCLFLILGAIYIGDIKTNYILPPVLSQSLYDLRAHIELTNQIPTERNILLYAQQIKYKWGINSRDHLELTFKQYRNNFSDLFFIEISVFHKSIFPQSIYYSQHGNDGQYLIIDYFVHYDSLNQKLELQLAPKQNALNLL